MHQDRIKGHPMSVDAMVKIAEAMVALKLKWMQPKNLEKPEKAKRNREFIFVFANISSLFRK